MIKNDFTSDRQFPLFGFLLVFGAFFIIVAKDFLTEGMFMDGLMYSAIAQNLSRDPESLWHLQISSHSELFYGHPPLAIWIQSLFYHIFGDHFWVDKLYSMSSIGLSAFVILFLWKELGFSMKQVWLTWLLWLSVPLVIWCSTNNLLENTMGIFVLLSVLFYLKSLKKHRYPFCFLSGTMLCCSFMCKGLTGLYPLAFPLIYWFCLRPKKLLNVCGDLFLMLLGLLIPFALLLTLSSDAAQYFETYWQIQIVGSLSGIRCVNSRFNILLVMFSELLIPLIFFGLFILYFWKKEILTFNKGNTKIALAFSILALCGVLPIMVSMKQRDFYILTVFPFFALAMAALLTPALSVWTIPQITRKWIKSITAAVMMTAIGLNVYFFGKTSRDKELLSDIHLLLTEIPAHSTINMDDELGTNYSFMLYLARYKDVSTQTGKQEKLKVVLPEHCNDIKEDGYELVNTGAASLCLMRKKEN